jgi:hypothetical protein
MIPTTILHKINPIANKIFKIHFNIVSEFGMNLHISCQTCLFLIMIRIYFIGLFILITAIVANILAVKLQLKSWYDLLNGLANSKSYWELITFKDSLWLFLVYPLVLGLGAVFANFIYLKLFPS